MQHPKCYTSSAIGDAPDLNKNFMKREESVSIYWDDAILNPEYNDDSYFKVVHQCEPPETLNIIDKLIANHRFYDLIMAWDERVLRECPNAVFLTESACSWLPRKWDTVDPFGVMNWDGIKHKNPVEMNYVPCDVTKKEFAVSFLTSSKNFFPGHRLRQEIYEVLPESIGDLRVFKHRSPPIIPDKRAVLEPYMFSIVPENSRHNGYYSEKIIDCFIAKTVPIYWGAPDIGVHFDENGIITFSTTEGLHRILSTLTRTSYDSLLLAIQNNYELALKGVHQWDLIENYITAGIEKKRTQGSARVESVPAEKSLIYRPLRKQ
jgi:hypothetical protein